MIDAGGKYRDPDRYGPALLQESVGVRRDTQTAVSLTPQEMEFLRMIAKYEGVSISVVVREGINLYLDAHPDAVSNTRYKMGLPSIS